MVAKARSFFHFYRAGYQPALTDVAVTLKMSLLGWRVWETDVEPPLRENEHNIGASFPLGRVIFCSVWSH